MTWNRDEIDRELAEIGASLPGLATRKQQAAQAVAAAERRLEEFDPALYRGRPSGAYRAALEELQRVRETHDRAQAAFISAHTRRRELRRALADSRKEGVVV